MYIFPLIVIKARLRCIRKTKDNLLMEQKAQLHPFRTTAPYVRFS